MRHMKKFLYVFFILSLIFFLDNKVLSQENTIHRIELDDDIINPVMAEYITTAVDNAETQKASCLIIKLDTPGGLLTSTRTIVKKIMNANVPIVVYVAPKGARAGSAGVFITLSAAISAMAPSTNIGAAHPVEVSERRSTSDSFDEFFQKLFQKEKTKDKKKESVEPMSEKILNDTKAWAAAIANFRGKNAKWAEKAVEESVSVTETDALKLGIIDLIAKDDNNLIEQLDGRIINLPQGEVTIRTKGVSIIDIPKNFRLRWLSALAHPNIAYILMMLGFYGLLFEITHAGAIFPGVAGTICIILSFFGLQILPTNYAGIALIVLAIFMFIAEVKITSYGLLTIGGAVSLFFGSLILFASPYEFMRVSIPIILSFTLSTLVIATFLTYIVVRAKGRHIVTGSEGLIGECGEILEWKNKSGKVFVHGENWQCESDEEFAVGNKVEITEIKGMILVVKHMDSR